MSIPISAPEVLNREFLEIRARILQIAASLDRMSRADGAVTDDPRYVNLKRALSIVQSAEPNRAEQIQLLFSRTYDEHWRKNLGVAAGRS